LIARQVLQAPLVVHEGFFWLALLNGNIAYRVELIGRCVEKCHLVGTLKQTLLLNRAYLIALKFEALFLASQHSHPLHEVILCFE